MVHYLEYNSKIKDHKPKLLNLLKNSLILVQKLPFFPTLDKKQGILPLKKPLLLHKNTKSPIQTFTVRHALVPHMYNQWHYHREIELMYVIKGNGTRYIGESIQPFFAGDMVLVGSNVPHFWQNDDHFFKGDPEVYAELILIQFVDDFLGDAFFLPELIHIKKLFERALHGIQFMGQVRTQAIPLLYALAEENEKNKVLELLQLLDLMAKAGEYQLLSDLSYHQKLPEQPSERIQEVCSYLVQHYRRPIALEEVARLANMTEKAFCRFFKKSTQKTLVQFITELRVSHACKLLLNGEHSIGEICFESGFNNLSNFNRAFKKVKGQTPKNYQRSMMQV